MPSSSLLIDSTEFRSAIEPAILRARRRVLIQVMTFEMDSIGKHFWDVFTRSPAKEKILCVDAFSTAKISDNLVFGGRYLTDSAFRQEVQETRQLLRYGKRDGVRIVVTNPMGTFLQKFPFRNHKKMMIVDDQAFLGGINFSEHNFLWRDLMLQTDCAPLIDSLVCDFHHTVAGFNQSSTIESPIGRLYFLDGRRSRSQYEGLFGEITAAKKSIDVISPYVTNPLLERLNRVNPSVRVRIINPAANNKPILQQALFKSAANSNVEVRLYQPGMSHLKAVLIDDTRLILGSYNFDFVGYELQQEVVLSTGEPALINDFRQRVLHPDLDQSTPTVGSPARFYYRWPWVLDFAKTYVRMLGRLTQ